MIAYIVRRLLLVVPTLFGIMLANFVIVQAAPGGPVEIMLARIRGEAVEATALQIGTRGESALDAVASIELGGEIEKAIAQLRPEYRSCILLRHVEGYAYEEIAQILDLPLGTVKTYIHRARHELRRALEHLRQ